MEIPRADIEIEMLTRYTANKVRVETMDVKKDPEVTCTNNWLEMTSAGLEPEMDINIRALETNLGAIQEWGMNGRTGDMEIHRVDIGIEMLTRYTANKVKVETMDVKKDPEVPCTNNWWEMTSAGLELEMDINIGALEANLGAIQE